LLLRTRGEIEAAINIGDFPVFLQGLDITVEAEAKAKAAGSFARQSSSEARLDLQARSSGLPGPPSVMAMTPRALP
jgi:hypothetical protein